MRGRCGTTPRTTCRSTTPPRWRECVRRAHPAREDQTGRNRRRLSGRAQSVRRSAYTRRQQRRRGGDHCGVWFAARTRQRFGRQHPLARALLRCRGAEADQRPVPNTGHFPPITGFADTRTVIGPMARSVDDLAVTLSIIAASTAQDASVVPMPSGISMLSMSVAACCAHSRHSTAPACSTEVVAAVSAAVDVLSKECATCGMRFRRESRNPSASPALLGATGVRVEESMAAVGRQHVERRRRGAFAVRVGSPAPRVPRLHVGVRCDRLPGRSNDDATAVRGLSRPTTSTCCHSA